MDGVPSEFREITSSMEPSGETATEGEGGDMSVRYNLLGGVPGGPAFRGRNLGFFRGDVPES